MKKLLKYKSLFLLILTMATFVGPFTLTASAAPITGSFTQFAVHSDTPGPPTCPIYRDAQGKSTIQIIPAWDKYLDCDATRDGAIEGFHFPGDVWLVGIALLEIMFRLALYLAVGFIIYGGFYMIISQGNPEKIQLGRQIIEQALTGFVISMLAIVIVRLLERSIK